VVDLFEKERRYLYTPSIRKELNNCKDWVKKRTRRGTATVNSTAQLVSTGLWTAMHMNSPTTVLWNPVVRHEVRH